MNNEKNQSGISSIREALTSTSILSAVAKTDRLALAGLVAANMVPIILALLFRWNLGDVVMFYWWENIVVGIYAIARIAMARGGGREMTMVKFFVVPFFTFHYFFFCFVHVIFLRLFFVSGGLFDSRFGESPFVDSFSDLTAILPDAGIIGLIALFVSHGISFVKNYVLAGEFKKSVAMLEMFRPYGRIVILHVCIILGGFVVFLAGSPMPMVILLMIAKTILDLVSHSVVHSLSQKPSSQTVE